MVTSQSTLDLPLDPRPSTSTTPPPLDGRGVLSYTHHAPVTSHPSLPHATRPLPSRHLQCTTLHSITQAQSEGMRYFNLALCVRSMREGGGGMPKIFLRIF